MNVIDVIDEPFKQILGGIASNLLEIDSLLRVAKLTTEQIVYHKIGFRLMRRNVEIMRITIRDNNILATYSEYTSRYNSVGWWEADIQDAAAFEMWVGFCVSHTTRRISRIIEDRKNRNKQNQKGS